MLVRGADGTEFDSDDIAITRVEGGQAVAYLKTANLRVPLTAEGESDAESRLQAFRLRLTVNQAQPSPEDGIVVLRVVEDPNAEIGHGVNPVGTEHAPVPEVGCPQCKRMRPAHMMRYGDEFETTICAVCDDWNRARANRVDTL